MKRLHTLTRVALLTATSGAAALAAVMFVACSGDPVEVTVPVTRVVKIDVTREVTREVEAPATREVVVERVVTVEVPVTVRPEVVLETVVVEREVTRILVETVVVEREVTRILVETVVVEREVTAQPDATSTPRPTSDATPTASVPTLYDVSSDREALIALYESTRGQRWTNNQNWLTSKPLAEWYGIQTNAAGRVTQIELPENGLRGTLPMELGRLEFLEDLLISTNAIRGTIPSSLGGLARLRNLILTGNDISGSIPVSLGGLARLRILDLSFNELTGSIPNSIGKLVNLESLNLRGNQLSGSIPRSLGDILLVSVYLDESGFLGCIPDGLQDVQHRGLPKLRFCVYVGGSPESDRQALVDLYNRTDGANWKDNSNWLTDAPLSDWYGVSADADGRVIELSLDQNGLTGQIPETIGALSQLVFLDLSSNALTGNIPVTIGNLVNLHILLLPDNLPNIEEIIGLLPDVTIALSDGGS